MWFIRLSLILIVLYSQWSCLHGTDVIGHGCVYYMITPWHLTWTRTVISSHNHNYCTDQTHSWAHPWHTAHYCCEEDLDPGSFVKIDFVPQHKRCLISIWWKFCGGQSRILPFPLNLMMALKIFIYTNWWLRMSHFVPFVFPTLIHHCHFLWEPSKNTPSRNIGKNNKIFFLARKYWARHTKQIVIKWPKKKPQDTKLWECSHQQSPQSRSGRGAPQPAINYNYHFRYQVIIARNARQTR